MFVIPLFIGLNKRPDVFKCTCICIIQILACTDGSYPHIISALTYYNTMDWILGDVDGEVDGEVGTLL